MWNNPYNRPVEFYPSREQEERWEGEAMDKADTYFTNKAVAEMGITPADVQRAWQEAVIAADLYEIASKRNYPRHVIEERREEMCSASNAAANLQCLYYEQQEVC